METVYVLCKDRTDYIGVFTSLERAQETVRLDNETMLSGSIMWVHYTSAGEAAGYWQTNFTIKPLYSMFPVTYTIWISQPDAFYESRVKRELRD